MRKLSMKQKRLIAQSKHFTPELMRSLEKENDYETLYQDAVRLFDDLKVQRQAQTIYKAMNYNQQRLYSEEKYLKDWR